MGGTRAPRAKFRPPVRSDDVVLDDGLVRRATELATSRGLTLVVAVAGAGKTTLAAAVAEEVEAVGWVHLDEHDSRPTTLLELVAVAARDAVGDALLTVEPLLARGLASPADARRVAAVLLDDLDRAGRDPTVVVLDDLHAVTDGPSLDLLAYLVEHLPANVHLLATSRAEPPLPLARLRARGVLGEVGDDDLALDAGQAGRLLNDHLGLGLGAAEVEALVDAASGWVTGIRLLGRSPEALDDYLDQELLGREPPEDAGFLADVAVLDTVTPLAAAALTGRDDAGAHLADLARRHGLFVQVVDRDEPRYRLHDLLRSHLLRRQRARDPARLAELHRSAACVAVTSADRVEHLLDAGAWDDAAEAIDEAVDLFAPPAEIHRAADWVRRLPASCRDRRRLRILDGLAAARRGDMGYAASRLEPLLGELEADGDDATTWLVVRTLHVATNDHDRYAPRLREIEGQPLFASLPIAARVEHDLSAAYGALFAGDWTEVARRLQSAVDLAVNTADVAAAESLAQHVGPLLAGSPGVVDLVAVYADWAAGRFAGHPVVQAGVVHQRAWTSLLRGETREAAGTVRRAPELAALFRTFPFLQVTLDWVAAAAALVSGDLAGAAGLLEAAIDAPDATELDTTLDAARRVMLARVLRQRGDRDGVRRIEERLGLIQDREPGAPYLTNARSLVAAQRRWVEGDLRGAEDELRTAAVVEGLERVRPGVVSPRVDLALVLAERGAEQEAVGLLADAVSCFTAWGTPGLLVQAGSEVIPLLRRLPAGPIVTAALDALDVDAVPAPLPVPGSTEVLSGREVQVLRLLDGGASNRVIAEALVISINTAKTHVRNVLGKLGVHSRGEAVAAARRHHLL